MWAVAGMKLECEGDLAEAMPILNEALAALDTIKDADIQYIKKLGNPPALIKLVMEVRLKNATAALAWFQTLSRLLQATHQESTFTHSLQLLLHLPYSFLLM